MLSVKGKISCDASYVNITRLRKPKLKIQKIFN